MGALPAALLHNITDLLASRIESVLDNAPDMISANTDTGIATSIDEDSADTDLQAALMSEAAAVDRQVLGPNYRTFVNRFLADAEWRALMNKINTYVKSEDGGSNASFSAYLTAVTGSVKPIIAEVMRKALGEGVFGSSGSIVGALHPKMESVVFDRVYCETGAGPTFTDETTDAGSVATADVVMFAADDYRVYLGSRHKFNQILWGLSTLASANIDCDQDVKYWNGNAWTLVSGLVDNTTGLSVGQGLMTYTMPTDWVPYNKDSEGTPGVLDSSYEEELYYIEITRREDTVVTPPVATWIRAVPAPIYNSGTALYGVDQPPLALIRVTGASTATITQVQNPDYTRWVPPGDGNNELKLRALTAFASNITGFTFNYTNQGGAAGSEVQSAGLPWVAPAAGATFNLVLAAGDTGVRAVTAGAATIATTDTAGLIEICSTDYGRATVAK